MDTVDSYWIKANQVVWRRIQDYCRYQPRSHQQVRQKLYAFKLAKAAVETILAALIEMQLVNESRFATAYAGERFRVSQWGRNKVRQALIKRQISPYCIGQAMAEVDLAQYDKDLQRLAEKKWSAFAGKGVHPSIRAKRTAAFLIGRGFEAADVWNVVQRLRNKQ
jgi:regulatory protein